MYLSNINCSMEGPLHIFNLGYMTGIVLVFMANLKHFMRSLAFEWNIPFYLGSQLFDYETMNFAWKVGCDDSYKTRFWICRKTDSMNRNYALPPKWFRFIAITKSASTIHKCFFFAVLLLTLIQTEKFSSIQQRRFPQAYTI